MMGTDLERILQGTPAQRWRTRQAVVLEWHDGPREGLCELETPKCTFYFQILAERKSGDQFDDRLFRVFELESGSVEQAIAAFGTAHPPTSPIWAPHGPYETEEEMKRIEDAIENIISKRALTRIICRTKDMVQFTEVWMDTQPR
jgi:hypothetical protein